MKRVRKVIVLGLDGFDPKIARRLMDQGALPNLARLAAQGSFGTVATTYPAQTPVAWSTFATGTNPGGHGIFDFLRRNPRTYLPDLALNSYEQKNAFSSPRAVNLRRGTPLWSLLSQAGIHCTVLRCPCTYPPDPVNGRLLAGMGVPDLRGGFGTSTFFTSAKNVARGESENIVEIPNTSPTRERGNVDATREQGHINPTREQGIQTNLPGPLQPRSRNTCQFPLTLVPNLAVNKLVIRSSGQPQALEVRPGQWSAWLKVKFKTGLFQSSRGAVRFFLRSLAPELELYASPVNFDPEHPLFPISSPAEFANELTQKIGAFHTTGMAEDHGGLNNERFDECAYLQQCADVWREREQMAFHELDRFKDGFYFCLFDTPDRIQHMFWRHQRGADIPVCLAGSTNDLSHVIDEHYRQCDTLVGRMLAYAGDDTLFITLSDHGFGSFERGVHLNSWLHAHGLLKLKGGKKPGPDAGEFFRDVDWRQTKAYALGLAGIYLNLAGREEQGSVAADEAPALGKSIKEGLTGLQDAERAKLAVRSVSAREEVYQGAYAAEAPDLIVNFADSYRASWGTALGGVADGLFEDNRKKWSGDHIVDPSLVPGVLFMNRPFQTEGVRLVDLAPTILGAFGVAKGPAMEGRSVLA
ncbi:MAG: alkaline phosphatase family protein [Gemmataceae bacterium]|nr:alkaline phosphatase family protein [Gemmataceae bacterium]